MVVVVVIVVVIVIVAAVTPISVALVKHYSNDETETLSVPFARLVSWS